jgi:hypothetical protein
MGYSCTKDAKNMLGVIGRMFATDGNPNVLTIKGTQYFFERGREQFDGSITGGLYQILSDDDCRRVGTVKIAIDGSIDRFPKLNRADKQEAESTLHDMEARNPQLLSAWSMGRI